MLQLGKASQLLALRHRISTQVFNHLHQTKTRRLESTIRRAQKALEDERSQTGLNGNQKNITGTGANYATHYPTNKPLTATQRRDNLSRMLEDIEQRERFDNSTIIDADAFA